MLFHDTSHILNNFSVGRIEIAEKPVATVDMMHTAEHIRNATAKQAQEQRERSTVLVSRTV